MIGLLFRLQASPPAHRLPRCFRCRMQSVPTLAEVVPDESFIGQGRDAWKTTGNIFAHTFDRRAGRRWHDPRARSSCWAGGGVHGHDPGQGDRAGCRRPRRELKRGRPGAASEGSGRKQQHACHAHRDNRACECHPCPMRRHRRPQLRMRPLHRRHPFRQQAPRRNQPARRNRRRPVTRYSVRIFAAVEASNKSKLELLRECGPVARLRRRRFRDQHLGLDEFIDPLPAIGAQYCE